MLKFGEDRTGKYGLANFRNSYTGDQDEDFVCNVFVGRYLYLCWL